MISFSLRLYWFTTLKRDTVLYFYNFFQLVYFGKLIIVSNWFIISWVYTNVAVFSLFHTCTYVQKLAVLSLIHVRTFISMPSLYSPDMYLLWIICSQGFVCIKLRFISHKNLQKIHEVYTTKHIILVPSRFS